MMAILKNYIRVSFDHHIRALESSLYPQFSTYGEKVPKIFLRNRIAKKLLDFLDKGSLYLFHKSLSLYLWWFQILRDLNMAKISEVTNFESHF